MDSASWDHWPRTNECAKWAWPMGSVWVIESTSPIVPAPTIARIRRLAGVYLTDEKKEA